jgi:hypothetical protein
MRGTTTNIGGESALEDGTQAYRFGNEKKVHIEGQSMRRGRWIVGWVRDKEHFQSRQSRLSQALSILRSTR